MSTTQNHRSATPFILWLGYVAFVIYGSLVPLQYKARSMDSAIAAFQKIPFLKLGIESRADWISNGVLYVPVGILMVLALRAGLVAGAWSAGARRSQASTAPAAHQLRLGGCFWIGAGPSAGDHSVLHRLGHIAMPFGV